MPSIVTGSRRKATTSLTSFTSRSLATKVVVDRAALADHDVVGGLEVVDLLDREVADAGAGDGDQRHQEDADEQRVGGGRRPLRAAHRVVDGEPTLDAEPLQERPRRRAHRPGEVRRADEHRRHEGDGAEPDDDQARSRPACRASPRTTRTRQTMPRLRPSDADSVAASRIASIGSVRPARRAGIITDSTVMIVPSRSPLTMLVVLTERPPGSELPVSLQDALEQQRQQVAGDDAEHRAEDAEHDALEPQRALELPRRGADGGEHGELAQPLGDDHAERVVDDEPADQQRQDRERLQRLLQGLGERAVGLALVLRGTRRRSGRRTRPGTTLPASATSVVGVADPRR